MEQTKTNQLKNGILYLSAVQIVFLLFAYIMGPEMFGSFFLMLVKVLVIIGLLCYVSIEAKKQLGGFISYGALFKQLFVSILFMCLLADVVGTLLLQVIDPGFMEALKEMQINEMAKRFENANMPQEQIDDSMQKVQEQWDKPWYVNTLFAFGGGIVGWTIVSLIIAAIFQKKNEFGESLDS